MNAAPAETNALLDWLDQVCDMTMVWAAHFFESGDYGDQWDYVLSVHDDRAHKHAHILLNNRGVDQGT